MYNHKRQLILTFALGTIIGAGGVRFAYDNNILQPSNKNGVSAVNTISKPKLTPVDINPFDVDKSLDEAVNLDQNAKSKNTDQLCEIQEYMYIFGTYKDVIDGLSGKKTNSAIKESQKILNLPITGDVTTSLINRLRKHTRNNKNNDPTASLSNPNNPANGTILQSTSKKRIAPLEIHTTKNTGDYVIKLENKLTGQEELLVFMRGGIPLKVDVPLGKYLLKYANGATWYSKRCLFGINTNYNKADEIFNFTFSGQRVSGYTVELILQRHGNLRTKKLSSQQW